VDDRFKRDLLEALRLVRTLRRQAIAKGIDPRATYVALRYAHLADKVHARRRIPPDELDALNALADHLLEHAREQEHPACPKCGSREWHTSVRQGVITMGVDPTYQVTTVTVADFGYKCEKCGHEWGFDLFT